MKNVFVFSSARSGTNFLLSAFVRNSNFVTVGEIYKQNFPEEEFGGLLTKIKAAQIASCKAEIIHICGMLPYQRLEKLECLVEALGFADKVLVSKVFAEHLSKALHLDVQLIDEFKRLGSDNGLFIFLYRDSIFATYTSLRLAEHYSNWINSAHPEEKVLHFDKRDYLPWRNWYITTYRNAILELYPSAKSWIAVRYEDFVKAPTDLLKCVATRLEIESMCDVWVDNANSKGTVKQTKMNHEDYYLNQEDSVEFTNDSFERFLLAGQQEGQRELLVNSLRTTDVMAR